LGSAVDASNGTGFAAGKRHENVRALIPMYETGFITTALASQSITSMTALNGVRVGCGPLNVRLLLSGGYRNRWDQSDNCQRYAFGTGQAIAQRRERRLLARWFCAIPSLVAVANAVECVVFGLSPIEIAALSKRLTFMTSATYPAGTHRGQTSQINTVAAWNIAIAHKDLHEGVAYRITKCILS
jgi:TRAP-type uncharacterized transport system substrate-binding protein